MRKNRYCHYHFQKIHKQFFIVTMTDKTDILCSIYYNIMISIAKCSLHDNKEFHGNDDWSGKNYVKRRKWRDSKPPVTNYIGECFLKIANGLSYRPNFINYTYRSEMVSDGIENCLQYIHNFDPEKSKNPFAYFTQIIYYAFLRRIQKEKETSTYQKQND